ncbi:MAG TPA: hypothetical protein VGB98_10800 [Pyrinomonadaceae bacterium]|jgi:hypothetical protein
MTLVRSTVVLNQSEVGGSPAGDCGARGEGGGIAGGGRLRSNIIALNTIPRTSTSSSSIFRRFDLAGVGFDSRGYNYVGRSGDACCLTGTDRLGLFLPRSTAGASKRPQPRLLVRPGRGTRRQPLRNG